ncbi:hypothetical protein ACUNV4_11585 [Granulosicoccus sp. 3-233]|uniref:hypothetical protein n=1 Tax=Granulosicoccus sp. 3-233 TaxID=3417969 RepID=UPI003D35968B
MLALEAILASEKFVAAPQMSAFLRYVVEQAASGNKFRIKAYTVAVDALGKPDTFDPQNDPVVRVLAGRLRSSLAAYYEIRPDEDVVIEMKPGSYVPVFVLKDTQQSEAPTEETDHSDEDDIDHCLTAANSIISESDLTSSSPEDGELADDSNDLATGTRREAVARQSSHVPQPGMEAADSPAAGLAAHRAFLRLPYRFPKSSVAAAVILAFLAGTFMNGRDRSTVPSMQAASPARSPTGYHLSSPRQRPESLSLFVSAMEQSDSLVSQLSTLMSDVFSESEDIRVHRLFRSTQGQQYWPEDYLVSINVLPLPEETQVSVQLVDAQTGRITHVENLHLSTNASKRLSAEELQTIMDCAHYLISASGPLRTDYQAKIRS